MDLPSVGITVPTWNRQVMVFECVVSLLEQTYPGHIEIMVVDDRSTDDTIREMESLQSLAEAGDCYPGPRSLRITHGPGRSNWLPGAIHFPVFRHWLQTKTDFVSYQFSDELSHPERIQAQIDGLRSQPDTSWSYCSKVKVINGSGQTIGHRGYDFHPNRVPGIFLMTPSLLIDRKKFESVGGLDYPIHAAAQAESWIIAHAAFTGKPYKCSLNDAYIFREHEESLGHGQRPNSRTYHESIAETGFVEEDHWRLWNRIGGEFDERIAKWRGQK